MQLEGENKAQQLRSAVSLRIEKRLQESFGTCRTLERMNSDDIFISPTPAIAEKVPSAIHTFLFPAQGL